MSAIIKEEVIYDEAVGLDTIGECVRKCGKVIIENYNMSHLYNAFMTCMYEAVANAVKHGNNENTDEITIIIKSYIDKVKFFVKDNGIGFDWKNYNYDFTNDLSYNGRGLKIIKYYAEELFFNEEGNIICITLPVK